MWRYILLTKPTVVGDIAHLRTIDWEDQYHMRHLYKGYIIRNYLDDQDKWAVLISGIDCYTPYTRNGLKVHSSAWKSFVSATARIDQVVRRRPIRPVCRREGHSFGYNIAGNPYKTCNRFGCFAPFNSDNEINPRWVSRWVTPEHWR